MIIFCIFLLHQKLHIFPQSTCFKSQFALITFLWPGWANSPPSNHSSFSHTVWMLKTLGSDQWTELSFKPATHRQGSQSSTPVPIAEATALALFPLPREGNKSWPSAQIKILYGVRMSAPGYRVGCTLGHRNERILWFYQALCCWAWGLQAQKA